MEEKDLHIRKLQQEIEELRARLFESENIVEAIREGAVDALVLTNGGTPQVYSLESADFTYRILIEKFSEGAMSITDEGLILYCNDAFSKLAEVPAEKITGAYFFEYIDSKQAETLLKKAISEGSSSGELTLKVNSKMVQVSVSFTNLQPYVSAIGVIIRDLTEKKNHESDLLNQKHELELKVAELNTTNNSLGQFIHVISHDLKEPLRKILMHISRIPATDKNLISGGKSDPVDVIKSSAIRLNSLVVDLVKYSFVSIPDEKNLVKLDDILKEVQEDLELIITERNAEITIQPLPELQASGVQMRQLFSNLLANAIKYCQQGCTPKISISWTEIGDPVYKNRDGKFYKISVSDNGIGMDEQHSEKIFTIFQRLHMRDEYSGNGIGLAICKKIIENHSGSIEVESAPGKGSTFHLYLPKDAPQK